MLSVSCLKEVNRLRVDYRPDLSLYAIPAPSKVATKRKLSGSNLCGDQPRPKKQRTATKTLPRKRKQTFDKSSEPPVLLLAATQVLLALTAMTVSS